MPPTQSPRLTPATSQAKAAEGRAGGGPRLAPAVWTSSRDRGEGGWSSGDRGREAEPRRGHCACFGGPSRQRARSSVFPTNPSPPRDSVLKARPLLSAVQPAEPREPQRPDSRGACAPAPPGRRRDGAVHSSRQVPGGGKAEDGLGRGRGHATTKQPSRTRDACVPLRVADTKLRLVADAASAEAPGGGA